MVTAAILYLLGGGLGLYFGGEFLVKGSTSLALRFKISLYTVGATVVAFGTSAPELFVSLNASYRGKSDMILGNVLGSNIANIGLIIGVMGLMTVIPAGKRISRIEVPCLIGITILNFALCLDGETSRIDGIILLISLAIFLIYSFKNKMQDSSSEIEGILSHLAFDILLIVGGLIVLAGGSELFIKGASDLATLFGVPTYIIGLSVVALGTSLPELVTGISAARKGVVALALGNVLGSNIFNICLIQGVVGVLKPFHNDESAIRYDFPVALIFVAILLPFIWTRAKITFGQSLFLLLSYFTYIGLRVAL